MPTPNRTSLQRRDLLSLVSARADVKSLELGGRSRDDLALLLRAKTAALQNGSAIRLSLLDIVAIGLVALERHDELQRQPIAMTLGDRHLTDAPTLER